MKQSKRRQLVDKSFLGRFLKAYHVKLTSSSTHPSSNFQFPSCLLHLLHWPKSIFLIWIKNCSGTKVWIGKKKFSFVQTNLKNEFAGVRKSQRECLQHSTTRAGDTAKTAQVNVFWSAGSIQWNAEMQTSENQTMPKAEPLDIRTDLVWISDLRAWTFSFGFRTS